MFVGRHYKAILKVSMPDSLLYSYLLFTEKGKSSITFELWDALKFIVLFVTLLLELAL